MRIVILVLAAGVIVGVAQAQPLKLVRPADLNKDGVVTDDEQADYLAKQAAGAHDQPDQFQVKAPKPAGASVVFGQAPANGSGATLQDRTSPASTFEQYVDEKGREAAAKRR